MVATSTIEAKLAFESQSTPVNPASEGSNGVARQGTKPDSAGAPSVDAPQSPAGGSEPAYSINLSDEAQQVAANDPGSAPQAPAPQEQQSPAPQGLDATVETSATAEFGSAAGADTETNQTTSFESERTGNDTGNQTEAGRTLGQVIDTFA